jgi:oligosaccharide repeat unit polymerase
MDGGATRPFPSERLFEWVAVLLFGVLSAVLFAFCLVASDRPAHVAPGLLASIGLLVFVLHLALAGRRLGTFDPALWIPVAMLAFYFGMPYARALGAARTYEAWSVDPPLHLVGGFATALLTLSAFLTGLHLHGLPSRARLDVRPWSDLGALRLASILVFALGALLAAIGFVVAGAGPILGEYGASYEAKAHGADFRFFDLGLILAKAGLLGVLASHHRASRRLTLAALVASALLLLFSARLGDRGGMLSFALPAAWIFSQRIRAVRRVWILPGILIAVLAFPSIKEYRETGSLSQALRIGPLEGTRASLYEAGSSVLTYCYTLDLIPAERPFGWGISYLRAVLHLIPNLGLSPGKAFLPDPLSADPAAWLVERIQPAKYAEGGGYGYAVGAEWYFNFGFPGVLLGMVLFGHLLGAVRKQAVDGPYRLLLCAFAYWAGLLIVRNVVAAPLKAVVWSMLALTLTAWLLRLLRLAPATREVPAPAEPGRA